MDGHGRILLLSITQYVLVRPTMLSDLTSLSQPKYIGYYERCHEYILRRVQR